MVTLQTNFPCGNGRLVETKRTNCGEYISFVAEPKLGEPQPLWFYFRAVGLSGDRAVFHLANASQCLDEWGPQTWGGNRPVFRRPGGDWTRVNETNCELDESLRVVVTFEVNDPGKELEVAFCYPYPEKQLLQTLDECPDIRSTVIGYSGECRPLRRIFTSTGDKARSKPGVYVLARQHCGEVSGAWVLDGLLRFLASEEGRQARESIVWWGVPIVDIDGCEKGGFGKDQRNGDFNRSWNGMSSGGRMEYGDPAEAADRRWREEFPARVEISAIEHDMDIWAEHCRPSLIVDFHSPSHEDRRVYYVLNAAAAQLQKDVICDLYDRTNQFAEERGLPKLHLWKQAGGYGGSAQASGWNVTKYGLLALGVPSVTLETTYQGSSNGDNFGLWGDGPNFTIEDYRAYGECVGKAICSLLMK